jgi:hypothetical protein
VLVEKVTSSNVKNNRYGTDTIVVGVVVLIIKRDSVLCVREASYSFCETNGPLDTNLYSAPSYHLLIFKRTNKVH